MRIVNNPLRQPLEVINEINEFYIREISTLRGKSSGVIASIKAAWKTELRAVV